MSRSKDSKPSIWTAELIMIKQNAFLYKHKSILDDIDILLEWKWTIKNSEKIPIGKLKDILYKIKMKISQTPSFIKRSCNACSHNWSRKVLGIYIQ